MLGQRGMMSATDGLKVTAPILFIDSDIMFLILLFIAQNQ